MPCTYNVDLIFLIVRNIEKRFTLPRLRAQIISTLADWHIPLSEANKALAHWQIGTLAHYLTPISAIYDELLAKQTKHWHISRLAD